MTKISSSDPTIKYVCSDYDKNSDNNINGDEASESSQYTDSTKMSDTAASKADSLFTTAKDKLNTAQQKVFSEKQTGVLDTLKTRAKNYA